MGTQSKIGKTEDTCIGFDSRIHLLCRITEIIPANPFVDLIADNKIDRRFAVSRVSFCKIGKEIVDRLIRFLGFERKAVRRCAVRCALCIQNRCRLRRCAVGTVEQEPEQNPCIICTQGCNQRVQLCDHRRIKMGGESRGCVGILRISADSGYVSVSRNRNHRMTDAECLCIRRKRTRNNKPFDSRCFGTRYSIFCQHMSIIDIGFADYPIFGTLTECQYIFCAKAFTGSIR